jgi:hypothetical protein
VGKLRDVARRRRGAGWETTTKKKKTEFKREME